MITNPIIPIFLMIIICIFLIVLVIINKKHIITRLLIIILLFVINLRPMKINTETESFNTNLDVLFVVDTTISMDALDMNGTRLNRAISDIKTIMSELSGSNFALITFGNNVTIVSPFTFDTKRIETAISNLETADLLYANGTAVDKVIDQMELLVSSSSERENVSTVVFFITDGEFNKTEDLSGFKKFGNLISSGAVVGYGTKEGGKIKLNTKGKDYYKSRVDEDGYLLDMDTYPYKPAVSKLDENNLRTLADNLSIEYVQANNINKIVNNVKKGVKYNTTSKTIGGDDYYFYFSFLLIPLFLYEIVIYRREL